MPANVPAVPVTGDEASFIRSVVAATGIDPKVLLAWIRSEGHPGDYYHNYLNIAAPTARFLHVPISGIAAADTAEFGSLSAGVLATDREIRNLGLHFTRGETPQAEIAAIAASPWASSHYGGPGGPNLLRVYEGLGGTVISGGSVVGGIVGGITKLPGEVGGAISGAVGGIFGGVESLVLRGLLILAGSLLVIAGLFFIARSLGASVPKPIAAAAAALPVARALRAPAAASAGSAAASSAAAREQRAQEAHAARLEHTRARTQATLAAAEGKRGTKAEREQAEKAAYFRGATDAAHEQQAAAAAAQARKRQAKPQARRKARKR